LALAIVNYKYPRCIVSLAMVETETKYEVHCASNDNGRIEWCETEQAAEELAEELSAATDNRHVVIEV